MSEHEKLTVAEAADYARRHPGSIRRAITDGDLHGSQTKRGGRYLIQPACIDAYLAGGLCEHRQNVTQLGRGKRARSA